MFVPEKPLLTDQSTEETAKMNGPSEQVQTPPTDPAAPKENSKICIECGKTMPVGAKKCTECDTFQDWRRYLFFSSNILSLLVALCSVLGLSIPAIVASVKDHDAKLHVAILGNRIGFLTQTSVPPRRSLVIDLFVTNSGQRPGMIKAVGTRFEGEPLWDYNSVIFDKDLDGKMVSVAWTTSIIEPGRSRILEVYHPTDLPQDRAGKFWLRIEYLRFDMKPKTIQLNAE
jgi:hypothetical protein